MKYINFVFTALFGLMYLVIILAMFAAHIWTVVLAYRIAGPLAGLITFLSPPLAEVYWAFVAWYETGVFFNAFVQVYAVVVGLFVLQAILAYGMEATKPARA